MTVDAPSKEEYQLRLERWAERLKSQTISHLPADYSRPVPARSVEATFEKDVDLDTEDALVTLAMKAKGDGFVASPFVTLLTAFIVLVNRMTGDEDISVGTSSEKGTPFVLRSFLNAEDSFLTLLKKIAEIERNWSADTVDFNDLLQHLNAGKSEDEKTRNGLVYTRFYNAPDAPSMKFLSSTGLDVDVTVIVSIDESKHSSLRADSILPPLKLQFIYNQLLFSKARISILASQLLQVVKLAAKNVLNQLPAKISLITDEQKALLPDPTKDLGWSDFRGAIHDIFADNAKKFPERECVVVTPPVTSSAPTKSFTYRQIHEASNVLAHHLVKSGVQRGEVVMVYAYRGVDLVIAVMGVLKAGATFSVIDPAYPPARQIIYLSVAKPRALVVLKDAGVVSPTVVEYVEKNLDIRTFVPSLKLHDDGSVTGGEVNGSDILADTQSLRSKDTGVVVGPDSTPTLSFTSGSEGVPKGVRGRHFSLAYYFDWMSKEFSLTENDRFTMLSGIAHDPIQRDIFTPLFLGASLIVPTADDIGTPGQLAEWASKYQVTVTHLTPAMGQLLSAQAEEPIPSLHHAFFVGDVLTKRDCLRLQALAVNTAVVNMYGTTETQRAVSYFVVPSRSQDPTFLETQKEIIPAGRGMYNVQLLVVNRHDPHQICGIGEVGEIYVRAGGLAEGYLGNEELSKTKFLTSWFADPSKFKDNTPADAPWKPYWFGIRDRMYRSGDLGRYIPSGDVECTGRADDQVKIRGFRIELGEINTHLSRHPNVRENITLVRRNKDEEPTLVAYVVPQNLNEDDECSATDTTDPIVSNLRRYRKLIRNIREYLKTKLPSYAVPSVVIPMNKMPLNPNGKIDKPALPFPDTNQLAAAFRSRGNKNAEQLTKTEEQMKKIWLAIIPHATEVSKTANFFDVGGHSILATRLIFELRKVFAVNVPLGLVFQQPTIEGLSKEIDRLKLGDVANVAGAAPSQTKNETELSYSEDARALVKELPQTFTPVADFSKDAEKVVFLTGGNGYLGVFILRDLLQRNNNVRVYVLVRAKSEEHGLQRLQDSCIAYGVWEDAWKDKITVVTGDLAKPQWGMDDATWKHVAETVDTIIHNGALVHWVYPYTKLRGPNVIGTLTAINLCSIGKPKSLSFVSSTSTLDNEHYVNLSADIMSKGGNGVPESDDLEGSAVGLQGGYGQSKWAAEYLIRQAGARGLRGVIVRPGYIFGDSRTGAINTDDFLVRMIKGSTQLGLSPDINNTVNMVPTDHVARCATAAAFHPPKSGVCVAQVTSHPRLRFSQFLGTLPVFGFNVKAVEYLQWRVALERHVSEANDNALYPLLHFVLDNLPANTKAPELDDKNTHEILKQDTAWTGVDVSGGAAVLEPQMGLYLAYLVKTGFLKKPEGEGKPLPKVNITEQTLEKLQNAGGRGGSA
ncbi:aminoadipate-semialdehyde dehydrogenase [Schizosaccharomyces japonicus yFS275]|uniref:Alpha-aminoadipate reductase n=1 Tax=Schizosaccharomyces japonicus (strain yFS275 / FY16936) TaxID=402676 RepID=B6JWU4_SCHJY|nr:aminoadipate-semialdehyde dehydrogenase [Schizosaccharomyces japonicus yFS275]EEB05845.1 aminoadipate-semialdehyde dehydrogenase [Schizosaccharomyces japonicus yFS275]